MIVIGIDPGFKHFGVFGMIVPEKIKKLQSYRDLSTVEKVDQEMKNNTLAFFMQDVVDLCPGQLIKDIDETTIAPAIIKYLDLMIQRKIMSMGLSDDIKVVIVAEYQAKKIGGGLGAKVSKNPMINHILVTYCNCRGYEYYSYGAGKKLGDHTSNKIQARELYTDFIFNISKKHQLMIPIWNKKSEYDHIYDAITMVFRYIRAFIAIS